MPRSLLVGADGGRSPRKPDRAKPSRKVVAHTGTWLVSDHPVCGANVGCAKIFLMPQPPLLTRRGLRETHPAFCTCVCSKRRTLTDRLDPRATKWLIHC